MAKNGNTPNKINLYPDQLTSLLSLTRILPAGRYAVLLALLHYVKADSLKSRATRDQIEEFTGLGKRTIYTCIQEFDACGLIKQWRGPYETKQKFYRINLPVSDSVFEFYGNKKVTASRSREQSIPDDSNPSNLPVQVCPSVAPEGEATPPQDPFETNHLHEVDMAQVTTNADNRPRTAEIATEPALDPRIIQVLDLKATEDGNVIVRFLKGLGLCRINSFGTVRIDRDRLLSYLLERDANSLEGFSRLLAEFKASPQFDLPPDEDLKLDLHNSFFHYPLGAQWFWQNCHTKDDNGCLLREGGFGAKVLAFMAEHDLKRLDDIVQKVAQMDEELRPERSASEIEPS